MNTVQRPSPHSRPFLRVFTLLTFALLIAILSSLATYYYVTSQLQRALSVDNSIKNGKPCTMEAKLCPDGSAVGRTGPNCEFAPCPVLKTSPTPDPSVNWKTYSSKEGNFFFKYPVYYTLHINEQTGFELPYMPNPNSFELDARTDEGVNKNLPSNYPFDIKINFEQAVLGTTIDSYAQKYGCGEGLLYTTPDPKFQHFPSVINRSKIIVDGYPAIICGSEGAGGYDSIGYILYNNLFYQIFIPASGEEPKEESYFKFLKLFLSTFKFLK